MSPPGQFMHKNVRKNVQDCRENIQFLDCKTSEGATKIMAVAAINTYNKGG